jgi:hypothetical protein
MDFEQLSTFHEVCSTCITECIQQVRDPEHFEIVIVKIESMLLAIEDLTAEGHNFSDLTALLEESLRLLLSYFEQHIPNLNRATGRPPIPIKMDTVGTLLSLNFTAKDVAKMLRISKATLYRRMKLCGLSVSCLICCIKIQLLFDFDKMLTDNLGFPNVQPNK